MALEKTFTNPANGAVGEYWRITGYLDQRKEKVNVTVVCYKDKEFRDSIDETKPQFAGSQFIAAKTFRLDKGTEVDYIADAYEKLKAEEFFTGAADV